MTDQTPETPEGVRKSAQWAVDNCHLLARREIRRLTRELAEHSGTGSTPVTVAIGTWQHVLRICEESGVTPTGVLREAAALLRPTEMPQRDLIERAQKWLQSNPDVPYDAAHETELDAQHHNEAYDLIEAFVAALPPPAGETPVCCAFCGGSPFGGMVSDDHRTAICARCVAIAAYVSGGGDAP